ncbi:MAG: D-alanyl-D-alanine carboxypeptidase [Lachnospiraceae bacterium]|nr:D-alanyl-D-alanine carboxypeptidase [Lachnospiraceae bacterium]
MMKRGSVIPFVLCIALSVILVTGCGANTSPLNYRPQMQSTITNSEKKYEQEYLSKDICVIPKNGQSKADSDSVMTAGASMIVNDTTQTMLFSKKIYKKMYPASITKIVTALVTLKYGNLEDTVTFSHNAANITEPGAKLCGFQEGDKIVLKDLLYSFLVYSGNDAGVAIAEHIGGSVEGFADMMNREVQDLGASGSHFVNPHGLHNDEHYTTVYDLYLVFHELLQYDTFMDAIHKASYNASYTDKAGKKQKKTFPSTDRYLIGTARAPKGITVVGGKTGTTQKAGSCLILYSKDAKGDGYISVVLHAAGGESLYLQMNKLLEYIK